jgi:hypothetical protein
LHRKAAVNCTVRLLGHCNISLLLIVLSVFIGKLHHKLAINCTVCIYWNIAS